MSPFIKTVHIYWKSVLVKVLCQKYWRTQRWRTQRWMTGPASEQTASWKTDKEGSVGCGVSHVFFVIGHWADKGPTDDLLWGCTLPLPQSSPFHLHYYPRPHIHLVNQWSLQRYSQVPNLPLLFLVLLVGDMSLFCLVYLWVCWWSIESLPDFLFVFPDWSISLCQ